MIIDATFGLKGRYKAVVRGPDMEVRRESAWSDNVVTNLGVQMLLGGMPSGGPTTVNLQCSCGAGNSTPLVTDTQIQSFIASTSNSILYETVKNSSTPPYYVMHRIKWRFPEGQAQGNVSELCVISSATAGTSSSPAFSRSLVRDSSGNPTTITVQSDEYLEVTYELFIYIPQETSGTFYQTIDGSLQPFTYVMKTSGINAGGPPGNNDGWPGIVTAAIPAIYGYGNSAAVYSSTGSLGPITGVPSGTRYNLTSSTTAAGNYPLKYRDITYTASLDSANATFAFYNLPFTMGAVQMQISPPITKVNTKTYTITIRVALDNTI